MPLLLCNKTPKGQEKKKKRKAGLKAWNAHTPTSTTEEELVSGKMIRTDLRESKTLTTATGSHEKTESCRDTTSIRDERGTP